MFEAATDRTITILRPVGLHPSRFLEEMVCEAEPFFEEECEENVSVFDGNAHHKSMVKDGVEESIEIMRELIMDVAGDLHIRTQVYEYDIPASTGIPSYKATRWIGESNMIATVDPTESQLAFISGCMRMNPLMSALIASTEMERGCDNMNDLFEILGAHAIQMIHATTQKLQRIFVAPLKHMQEEKMTPAIKKALLYPL